MRTPCRIRACVTWSISQFSTPFLSKERCWNDVRSILPSTPTPSTNTGVPTKCTGTLYPTDLTTLKPRCWKKWRRKALRAKRDASSPVDTQLPPWKTTLQFENAGDNNQVVEVAIEMHAGTVPCQLICDWSRDQTTLTSTRIRHKTNSARELC